MKKKVFLTGATGTMGFEGFKQLWARRDKFHITVLIRASNKNKEMMSVYEEQEGIKIIWGDLCNYEDVAKGVEGVDYVLHVAAVVSPEADYDPDRARRVNVESTMHIIHAIKNQPNKDEIKLVYIGTVAETGDRLPPIHWGRTGDPLKPSVYDNYAITKIQGEREVIESGLKYWVSLRQSGIAHFRLLDVKDGIIFHQPLENCLEWITAHDSGVLLANICELQLPEEFWCRIYNIGGGENCRTTGYEFLKNMYSLIGIKDFRKVCNHNWFALRNFHGQWYEDSYVLNNYLHFQRESLEDFYLQLRSRIARVTKLIKFIPKGYLKRKAMLPLVRSKNGPVYWIENNIKGRISAFFGSKEQWEKILPWNQYEYERPSNIPLTLNHGYDESKEKAELDIEDMKEAARFRGGKCLSETMVKGDMKTKLKWQCAFCHEFEGSPTLVLLAGHWCPYCEPAPWNYDKIAKKNPFFAQVWYPIHNKEEDNFYDKDCYRDIL